MTNIFKLMALYNQRMNLSVYDASAQLSEKDNVKNCGAFFGSIIGTLNHILVGDLIWLKRFAMHPENFNSLESILKMEEPQALDQILYAKLAELRQARLSVDRAIVQFTGELTNDHLQTTLHYKNMNGQAFRKNFGGLVQHLFNHQTHHRGQVSTLLSQIGIEIGVTDLLVDIPDEREA